MAACCVSVGLTRFSVCCGGASRIVLGFEIKFVTSDVGDCERCDKHGVNNCLTRDSCLFIPNAVPKR